MAGDWHPLLRLLGWTLAYFLAGLVAVWFAPREPDAVSLIWPAAGIGFTVLLVHGLRYWPVIALPLVPLHLWVSPTPWLFVPFSIAANVIPTVLAVLIVRRAGVGDGRSFSIRSGVIMLGAGVFLAATSAVIGTIGMLASGMAPPEFLFARFAAWTMADLVGMVSIAPALIAQLWLRQFPTLDADVVVRPRRTEFVLWALAFAASLWVFWFSGSLKSHFALAVACLPLALVVWAAMRFHPVLALSANAVFSVGMATIAALGLGGFQAPRTLAETAALTCFLLVAALLPQILTAANFQLRVASHRQVRRSRHDPMTRLPNRLSFERELRFRLDRGARGVLLYVDLDQFKVINDSLSHAAGDAYVLGAAGLLQSRIGPGQFLARLGGDEFALLVADDGQVPEFANSLVAAIADLRLPWDQQVMATTASIGAAPFEAGGDLGEVLARADAACQAAKDLGGNRLHWSDASDEGVQEKRNAMRWAVRLAKAIDEDRFELHCQSIVPLKGDGDRRRFEVLLRMREEGEAGLLMPTQFVPAAERFNLGPRLDRHVLDKTLRWFEASPGVLGQVQHVSVNLSAATLTDAGFPEFVRRRLADSVLPPECLCFEITETTALRDLAKAARMIDLVRELGAHFALDDFGTGFCSFAYLAQLRVDYFKIDGSFVRDLGHSPLALSIVRSIVDIGKVTNTQTVAECVETTALRAKLGVLGVDFAQGYAIDRPREISEYFSAPPPDAVALTG